MITEVYISMDEDATDTNCFENGVNVKLNVVHGEDYLSIEIVDDSGKNLLSEFSISLTEFKKAAVILGLANESI